MFSQVSRQSNSNCVAKSTMRLIATAKETSVGTEKKRRLRESTGPPGVSPGEVSAMPAYLLRASISISPLSVNGNIAFFTTGVLNSGPRISPTL